MSRKVSVNDYPDYLNPFDDNYNGLGVAVAQPGNSRQKYNTWGASRPSQLSPMVSSKPKPTLLEKPWRALHISPKSKIVRNLSFLKTAVERFTSKKKRLTHSSSYTEGGGGLPPRSHSVHDDLSFRIISPKLKERIRQQAFSKNINNQPQTETNSIETTPSSPQLNGRLSSPTKLEVLEPLQIVEDSPPTPKPRKEFNQLGARPKTRKKRPPPPPPTDRSRTNHLEISNGKEKAEDTHSVNSSITQDLEKDASSEDDISSTDLNNQTSKSNQKTD